MTYKCEKCGKLWIDNNCGLERFTTYPKEIEWHYVDENGNILKICPKCEKNTPLKMECKAEIKIDDSEISISKDTHWI